MQTPPLGGFCCGGIVGEEEEGGPLETSEVRYVEGFALKTV
jgi:hypothetical protein